MPRSRTMDGVPVPMHVGEWDSECAVHAVFALVDCARVHKAAGQAGVAQELSALHALVAMIEQQPRRMHESADDAPSSLARLTPTQRLKLFKRLCGAAVSVTMARNTICDVVASHSDDSSAQAAFLNGAQSKYRGKYRLSRDMARHHVQQDAVAERECWVQREELERLPSVEPPTAH